MIPHDATPSVNGHAVEDEKPKKPAPKRRMQKAKCIYGEDGKPPDEAGGRVLTKADIKGVKWFLSPWVPRAMVTLIVGFAGMGKSSLLAFLMSRAKRTVILPGYEEEVEVMTIPRLIKNGVDLKKVKWLDDKDYTLPKDQNTIARIVREWKADLVLFDPIQSYMDKGMTENSSDDVRDLLQSAFGIAKESRAAVIGVRHPGKERRNPMRGSGEWRNVPRSVIILKSDGGSPERRYIFSEKDSLGQDPPPREYRLEGERGEPKRFIIMGDLDETFGSLGNLAEDQLDRERISDAALLIMHLFDTIPEPTVNELVSEAKKLDISSYSRDKARKALNIKSRPKGKGEPWKLVRLDREWPEWALKLKN